LEIAEGLLETASNDQGSGQEPGEKPKMVNAAENCVLKKAFIEERNEKNTLKSTVKF
jgi:hypothetical protein